MKKSSLLILSGLVLGVSPIVAQWSLDPRSREDKEITNAQARDIFELVDPLTQKAGESTVTIYQRGGQICYGIVVGKERVIAKWSDLFDRNEFFVQSKDKRSLAAEPLGIYPDQDLVVLKVPELDAPAIIWGHGQDLREGSMMISVDSQGKGSALGVVSVASRSLRNNEEGFLGIEMDGLWKGEGVRVRSVTPGGAAEAAGVQAGDVLLQVGGEKVNGLLEMQTRIRRSKAGDRVELHLLRDEKEVVLTPTLRGYELEKMPEAGRLRRMDRMSTELSRVRDNFPNVIQSDMGLRPEDSGSPVVNLDGEVVGMVIARADRVSTLILPAEEVVRMLATEPQDVPQRRAVQNEAREFDPRRRMDRIQSDFDALRKMLELHLEELQPQP